MSAFVLKFKDLRFPLRLGETLLGRSPYCSIVLTDPLISRQHATFHVTRSGISIDDLNSRNGTMVNGQRLRGTRELRPGDTVEIGNQRFEIECGGTRQSLPNALSTTGEHKISVSLPPFLQEATIGL